jgi:hypothetical protein
MATKNPSLTTIIISNGADNEPRKVFIGGASTGDVNITRGKPVRVSAEVLERLDNAVKLVPEALDPEKPAEVTMVEQQRFPYRIVADSLANA